MLLLKFAPAKKYMVPYSISSVSIMKAKEAFFNKSIEIISHNVYTIAMDTTPNPL